ncbi:MAG: SGNH/GDSL hydrolase family protein [Vicinamibacteria bacterium]|nr:SGNH/GDSL hydrolase family protein [Vicinamibacteria bacterium]
MNEQISSEKPGAKRFVFMLVTILTGVTLALATLEIGSRVYENWLDKRPRRPGVELDLLTVNPHGTGSYRLKPNLDLTTRIGAQRVTIRTNCYGMPWHDVKRAPKRRQRIAFLGDSFTFGCWADSIEKSFVGVFESGVSENRFEVLNFGVPGYGLADVELLLREEVLAFAPDFVFVVVFTGNDFRDTYLGIEKERIVRGTAVLDDAVLDAKVPPRYLANDGRMPRRARERRWLRRHLESCAAYRVLGPFLGYENLRLSFAVNSRFVSYTFWSRTPYPPVALNAAEETRQTVMRIERLVNQHGAQLALVALPTREQTYAIRRYGADYDIGLPQAFLATHAAERGIPYLDLLPIFREHVACANKRLYVRWETHLNNSGHALAGHAMIDFFRNCVRPRRTLLRKSDHD